MKKCKPEFCESSVKKYDYTPRKYTVVRQIREGSVLREEEVEFDYPITPEYVTSFVEGADYHYDVLGALSRSVPRQNLGDIRDMQKVGKMDDGDLNALIKHFTDLIAQKKQEQVVPVVENTEVSNG